MKLNEYLDSKEVAELLGVSVAHIYRHTHEGTIPHYKFGHRVLFKEIEINDWFESKLIKYDAVHDA